MPKVHKSFNIEFEDDWAQGLFYLNMKITPFKLTKFCKIYCLPNIDVCDKNGHNPFNLKL